MWVDYDIHGWLGLRLVNPSPSTAKLVARQMAPLAPGTLDRRPDVSLKPLESEEGSSARLKLGDAGDHQYCSFDDSGFYAQIGTGRARMPFSSLGEANEIQYSSGTNMRSLINNYVRPILHLSLLDKGAIAVHSAAVQYNGSGILLAGWAESGKTEAMLALIEKGAQFVSDKWTILAEDGGTICNFPTPMTVRGWMVKYAPGIRGELRPLERLRVGIAASLSDIVQKTGRQPLMRRFRPLTDLAAPFLSLAGSASVSPAQVLPVAAGVGGEGGLAAPTAQFKKVFLLLTTKTDRIAVRPADPDTVARRLAYAALYERRAFFNLYTKFRYAFPDERVPLIEEAPERERTMLANALAGKDVHVVEMPFPFDPGKVYEAMAAYC